MNADEALLALRDVETGKAVIAHAGTVAWNAYRGRFVLITNETYGTSMLGEVWYAEAESPLGPWVYAGRSSLTTSIVSITPSIILSSIKTAGAGSISKGLMRRRSRATPTRRRVTTTTR